jgi:ABC-type multidrug transport system permease subunit
MRFFSGLLLVASKEFRHLRNDPYTLILTIGMPLFLMLLFGYALDTRVHDVPIAIQNLDEERFSRALVDSFGLSKMFRVAHHVKTEEELMRLIRRGEAKVAIQIPRGYSANAFHLRPVQVRVWVDGSDVAMAGQVVSAAHAIGLEQALAIAASDRRGLKLPIEIRPTLLFNPQGQTVHYFVPALVATLLETTTMLLVALSFVKERERGTLDQLRITGISLPSLIAGKLTACAGIGLVTGLLLTAIMQYVFYVPVAGSIALFVASLVLFLPPFLGLGLIVTAETRIQAQALQLTFLIGIPCNMLSGFIFPRETMPASVVTFSTLLPTTWSVQIARGIVLRGADFDDLAPAIFGSVILGVVYVSLGAFHLWRRLR